MSKRVVGEEAAAAGSESSPRTQKRRLMEEHEEQGGASVGPAAVAAVAAEDGEGDSAYSYLEGEEEEEQEVYEYAYQSGDDYDYEDSMDALDSMDAFPSGVAGRRRSTASGGGGGGLGGNSIGEGSEMDVSGGGGQWGRPHSRTGSLGGGVSPALGTGGRTRAVSGSAAAYRILTHDDLAAQQAVLVAEVMELLDIKRPLPAKLLLRRYRWDVATVMEHFEEATRFLCHLQQQTQQQQQQQQEAAQPTPAAAGAAAKGTAGTFACEICFDDCPLSEAVALACGHRYCRGCVVAHLHVKIEEGATKRLACPSPKCPLLYDEARVLDLVGAESEAGKRYSKQSVEHFLMDNPRVKGCPGADCGLYAELRDSGTTAPVVIKCPGCCHLWCFACARPPHFALPCGFAKQWADRTADEDEMKTIELLKRETKLCPWCGNGVHKFDGCNFMNCRCGNFFCYKCGGKVQRNVSHTWHRIDGHECGRIAGQGGGAASDTVRFMHYLQQYRSQRQLNEAEAQARGAEREEMEDIALVNKARKALANTYAFAYYAFAPTTGSAGTNGDTGGGQAAENPFAARLTLFEDKQQRLEQETELFARMLSDVHLHPPTSPGGGNSKGSSRPTDVDVKTQRGKLLHWLEAIHGTMEHDVLEQEAFGIRIPEFDLGAI